MKYRIIVILAGLLLAGGLLFASARPGYTVDCTLDNIVNNSGNTDVLKQLEAECQNQYSNASQQVSSLTNEIQLMDTKIYLTTLQIEETEANITKTQDEVANLAGRIDNLNSSLDHLSKVLLQKIVESYKRRDVPLVDIFLAADDASNLLNRLKYAKQTEENDQRVTFEIQQAKTNYEQQKSLRQQKEEELAQLQAALDGQKADLKNQEAAKQTLLAQTQSSESVYQSLIARAKQELAGFSAFTSAAGGGLTSFGAGSNGWYYTQRDPAWGNMTLPGSSYSVLEAGCAVTSVAMACKSYGQGITPAGIAGNSSNFIGGDLLNSAFSCSGKSTEWIGSSKDAVRSQVNAGAPVILRLYAPSVSGLHFVVAFKSDGDDFIIHDPYYGPDKKFSERYDWSQVTTAIAIH